MDERPTFLIDPAFRRMDEIFAPDDLERLRSIANLVWGQDDPVPEEKVEACRESVSAILAGEWRYGDVGRFPNLKAILEVSGRPLSADRLDYEECFKRGIRLLCSAPAFGPMVADMALGMAISAARQIVDGHNAMTRGEEKYFYDGNIGTFTLFDQPVGMIGFGGLAHNLSALLKPFRVRLQAYDPWLPDRFIRKGGAEPVDLETLLETSKVIFVLAIPSIENERMLNRELLEKIAPGSVLVLISRAHVVDFDALTDLVTEGRFKAAIDVFPEEPLPKNHPIRKAQGVILSAHRAGAVERDLLQIGRMAVDDLEAIAAGLVPTEMQTVHPEIIARLSDKGH